MSKIRIEGLGEWPTPESFTYREAQLIKRLTGLRVGEFWESLNAGDADAFLALAAVAAKRVDPGFHERQLLDLEVGTIEVIGDKPEQEEQADGPPADRGGARDGRRRRASSPSKS